MLPSHLPNPSTDLLIILTVGLLIVFGFVGGASKLARVAISMYVGLVLAFYYGEAFHTAATQTAGHGPFGLSATVTNLLLLAIPVVVLQFGANHHGHIHHRSNGVLIAILAVLTAMLVISSVLTQFTGIDQTRIFNDSNLATQIYNLRLVWLAAVPFAIAALAIFKPKHH